MKRFTMAAVMLSLSTCAALAEEQPATFKPFGGVQIQAQKALWDNLSSNNLDQLYGRINFGASASAEGFSGKINIRAYPAGFGLGTSRDTATEEWLATVSAPLVHGVKVMCY